MFQIINSIALRVAQKNSFVNWLYWFAKHALKKHPKIDFAFPNLVGIEVASVCNLKCIHCPSHLPGKPSPRKFGLMSMDLFGKIMGEVDASGKRRIALHKDGEPLLHPQIASILRRVKEHVDHVVYLTTNGHFLTRKVIDAIFEGRIDHVNVSIGAFSAERYKQIRGGELAGVQANILAMLEVRKVSPWKPRISVQIIDLKEHDMAQEISAFRRFWQDKDVIVEVWSEFSWGVSENIKMQRFRYPCYSLWDSFMINSDGRVSACCMDWNQSLTIGDAGESSIQAIWAGEQLRQKRIDSCRLDFGKMALCEHCNYWQWQAKIHSSQYPAGWQAQT